MYRVTIYNDSVGTIIHEPSVSLTDPHLYAGTLTQGSSGEIDSLQFEILPNNPGYDLLASRTTMVQVMDTTTDSAIFTGRVLTITPQMDSSGLVYKAVVCEDRLGFLCDSIQPYTPEATYTLEDFFALLLENHNAQVEDYKKIYPGHISMTTSSGNVTKGLNYQTTWECIKSKLLDSVGGEIQLYSGTDGLLYLDYVEELGSTGTATIALGKNMQSVSREIDPTSVITRLIPLGVKLEDEDGVETEERLTIASVNNGVIYLDDEDAQAVYGIVEGVVEWDDVTEASNLLTKAQAWLEAQAVTDQITLTAVDLYLAGIETEAIERYNYYPVTHEGIGLNTYYRVAKVSRNICNPTEITYEMGSQSKSLASTLADTSSKASSAAADATAAVNAQLSKTVTALIVSNATIMDLTVEVASINSLLAGNIGTGTVQTVHLTADNVVIDDAIITDAMIADLSASKLTAGTIYTDKVTIQSESGNLYITDNTIQIQDGATVRVQIGEDASGDYNLYLWDASGALIWDAQGLTEAGLTGNGAIIKDVAVADDANISGYKIDITTMTSALNEYGELVVDATQITIDNTTLDYKLSSMTTSTAEAQAAADAAAELATALESEAVANLTQYYALGPSAEEPPSDPAEGVTRAAALVDTAVVDESGVDITYADTDWTTEWIVASDGLYLWTAFFVEYADGHTEWTTPTCLSDGVARESISTLVTELEVVQGQITAKVWQTDIDTAVDEVNGTLTTLQDQYAQLIIDLDSISLSVGDLTTTVSDNYEALSSQISALTVTASEITASVSELEQTIEDNYTTLNSKITTISETADGISSTVSSLQTTVETNYTDLSSKITTVSETADGITATVSSLQTTVGSNYTELSDKISSLEVTADDITASVSSVQGGLSDLTDTVNGTVTNAVTYFAISGDTSPPCDPGETIIDATVDTAVVDSSLVGCIGWTTERLEAGEGEYLWTCNQLTLADGSTVWTTPVLVTDDYARTSVATLAVTTTGITATVSDLQSTVSGNYTNLSDKIAALTVTTDSITATVSDLTTVVSDNYEVLSDQITAVETTASGISATVSSLQSTMADNYETLSSQITTVETTASGISARVTQTESDISDNAASITTLSSELTQLADSIALCVTTDADTGYLRLGAGDDGTVKFTIEADNLTLDESGNLAMTGNLTVADHIIMSSDAAYIEGPSRIHMKTIVYGENGFVVGVSNGGDSNGYFARDSSNVNHRVLWLTTTDYVHIGNSDYPLYVEGTNVTFAAPINGVTTLNGSDYAYKCRNSSGTAVNTMWMSGNAIGLGSSSYSTYIYGSAIYSNVSITVSSDARLKEDIVALDSAHDTLFDGLRPVAYRYKADPSKLHLGMTVQDTEAAEQAAGLAPEDYALTDWQLDADTGERYGALAYGEVIALLVQQVQRLKLRVKALEGG